MNNIVGNVYIIIIIIIWDPNNFRAIRWRTFCFIYVRGIKASYLIFVEL